MSGLEIGRRLARAARRWTRRPEEAIGRLVDTTLAIRAARLTQSVAGLCAFGRSTRRAVRACAKAVLGSARYRHWLLAYSAHHGSFPEGWIPDDFFAQRVLPVINTSYRDLSSAKTLTRTIRQADELPDLAYLVHGAWFDTDLRALSLAGLEAHCFPEFDDLVVLKRESSNQGRGVSVLDRDEFARIDVEDVGNAVIQRRVTQHPDLERIAPGCTSTIRVTTMHRGGSVGTVGAYLRVGRSGERHLRSRSQLRVPIVDRGGTLHSLATAPDWSRHRRHPDTGVTFAGLVVPHYPDLVAVCERLRARVPQFTLIGWDVVPEADGNVALLEWNTDHPDIKFTEASFGPAFAGLGFEQL